MSTRADPFAVRTVLLRIGWMDHYRGVTTGDRITGGGAFVMENEYGHEMFNFQPFKGRLFGYVRPVSRSERWMDATIKLERISYGADGASLSGVLAVWVATSPHSGVFVVGWYNNSTVYRNLQLPPPDPKRRHGGDQFHYYATAQITDAVLLPPDERVFRVPQGGGWMGNSNVWYADDSAHHRRFRQDLLRYISTRRLPPASAPVGGARQPNPLLREQVEQTAIRVAVGHFRRLGYAVGSVERDNVGWDLIAVNAMRELKLEVKGLSGPEAVVDLTPNEYSAMRKHRDSYRVCVVTNALTAPCLEVFAYSRETGRWESPAGRVLAIEEIVAARCRAREAP